MKDTKNITLYLIPYLTLCGALYHISYWDTFSVNGLSFLSLSDIIKSSVYPVFTILLSVIYNLTIQNLILPTPADPNFKPILKKGIGNSGLLLLYSIFSISVGLTFYFTKYNMPDRLIFFGFINAVFPSIFLINNGFFKEYFSSERMRRLFIDLIVFIPVVSYYTGKYRSEVIYQNIEYKYSIHINATSTPITSTDTLKFIGNTENHFVFTDLKNTKILFVKSEKLDTLILYNKK